MKNFGSACYSDHVTWPIATSNRKRGLITYVNHASPMLHGSVGVTICRLVGCTIRGWVLLGLRALELQPNHDEIKIGLSLYNRWPSYQCAKLNVLYNLTEYYYQLQVTYMLHYLISRTPELSKLHKIFTNTWLKMRIYGISTNRAVMILL